ncbi:MAG: ABC transporter ATP-binding protein [Sneathiellaceae bacterium]
MTSPLLALERADAFYGQSQALHGVSLAIGANEVVALMGRNGAGKTTAIRTLCGLLRCAGGRRLLDGADASRAGPEALNRAGVALVPDNRQVFPTLTVEENLRMAQVARRRAGGPRGTWSLEAVYALFPRLAERRAARGRALSGGEQQMVAIGRAVLCNPRVLLLDEPTEGLAPLVVQDMIAAIRSIAESGVAVVLVEQNMRVPQALASRFYVMDRGTVCWQGDAAALAADIAEVERLLAI